jgi:NitT/TauT family transport system substrate-binding protein
MIKERPEILRKVVKVYIKALELANKDPEGVAAALKAMVPEIDVKVAEAQFRTTMPLVDNPTTKAEGIGTITDKRLAATWEWTAKSQNIAMNKINPESAINRSFMPKK